MRTDGEGRLPLATHEYITSPTNTRQNHHCLPSRENQDKNREKSRPMLTRPKTKGKKTNPPSITQAVCLLSRHLDALRHAVGLAGVDLLARLGNRLEHLGVGQRLLGDDRRSLGVERDLVGFDAWVEEAILALMQKMEVMEEKEGDSTLQLLQHAVDGARAAAAGHADVEDVFVLGAGIGGGLDRAGGGIDNIGHGVWELGWWRRWWVVRLLLSKQVLGAVSQRNSWRWWEWCWFFEEGSKRSWK